MRNRGVAIPPAWDAARERLGFENATGHGACQYVGSDCAELGKRIHRIGKRPAPDCNGEHGIAIERGVSGVDRARKTILRHDGELLGLRFAERRISCDDRDGRILARLSLGARREHVGGDGVRKAQSAEFTIQLE